MSSASVNQSATKYGAVTKSDTTELNFKALYVGGAGAVAVKNGPDGTSTVFSAVPAGTTLQVSGTHVMSTGTAATNIVWLDW